MKIGGDKVSLCAPRCARSCAQGEVGKGIHPVDTPKGNYRGGGKGPGQFK